VLLAEAALSFRPAWRWGLYAAACGAGEGPLLDETVTVWVHLQGEGAPDRAAFQASAAGQAVLAAWPGARVFQVDWT